MTAARSALLALLGIAALVPTSGAQGTPQVATRVFQDPWRWVQFDRSSGLPSDVVTGITETREGVAWVATDSGLARFDGHYWEAMGPRPVGLERYPLVIMRPAGGVYGVIDGRLYRGDSSGLRALRTSVDGLPLHVLSIAALPGDSLFVIGTTSDGRTLLWRWFRDSLRPTPLPSPVNPGTSYLWSRSPEAIFLHTNDGVRRWRAGAQQWTQVHRAPTAAQVRAYAATPDGSALLFLLAARGSGLYEVPSDGIARWLESEGINAAVAVELGPAGEALVVYETGNVRHRVAGVWRDVRPVPAALQDVTELRRRPNGDWWVGTRHGLYLYRASSTRWQSDARPFPDPLNRINAISRAHDGALWMGTGAGVIVRSPTGEERVIRSADGVTLDGVTALNVDADGGVWVGSGAAFEGALRWDGRAWTRFGEREGLPTFVHRIERDRTGGLWFLGLGSGTDRSTRGIYRLVEGRFERFRLAPSDSGKRIFSFADGPDGTLWFGTNDGMSRLRNGQWTQWSIVPSMRQPRVFTMATDSAGQLWFSDQSSGIGIVGLDDSLRFFRSADGLVDDRVWEIRRGPDERIWVATARGLGSYRDGAWLRFGAEEGLESLHLWPILPETAQVLVGTLGAGLQELSLAEGESPPLVRVAEPARVRDGVALAWRAHAWWGQQVQDRILTRFRIDTAAWSAWTPARGAIVALRPGRHTVDVQALGLFGAFGPVQSTSFDLPRPFTQQPLFFLPIAILLVALGVMAWIAAARRREATLEMRALEEQLRQSQKMEALGQLAGGVAHDFNNLLTAILGHADLLADALPPHSPDREDVLQIRAAAVRGATMIRKLLMFGQKGKIELEALRLDEVVAGLAAMLGRLLPESITLVVTHGQGVTALVDRTALEQSLVNLATNSRDAMPTGGELRIDVAVRRLDAFAAARTGLPEAGDYACIEVRDDGTGMDEATRARVFEPFFTTKPPDQGTGLGLAMVYSLTRRQGGGLELESVLGRGTEVRLYFPLTDQAPAAPDAAAPPSVRAPAALSSQTILVVEDEKLVRETTTRVLRQAGYRVETAADGEEALEFLRARQVPVDLVLTDVIMPRRSGYRLYESAVAERIAPRFIFTSGHTERHDVGTRPKGVPFLAKPWTALALLDLVHAELTRGVPPLPGV